MIESAAAAAGCWLHHTGFKVNGIYERTAHTHSQPASCSAGNGMIRTMKRSGTWTLFIVDGKRRQCCLHLSPMDVVDVQRGASSAQRLEPKTRENRKEMYVHYFVGTNNENTNECERCCCFSYSRTVHRTASTIQCYLRLALSISFLFCSVFGSTHYNHPMDMAQLRSARAGGFYFGERKFAIILLFVRCMREGRKGCWVALADRIHASVVPNCSLIHYCCCCCYYCHCHSARNRALTKK